MWQMLRQKLVPSQRWRNQGLEALCDFTEQVRGEQGWVRAQAPGTDYKQAGW